MANYKATIPKQKKISASNAKHKPIPASNIISQTMANYQAIIPKQKRCLENKYMFFSPQDYNSGVLSPFQTANFPLFSF